MSSSASCAASSRPEERLAWCTRSAASASRSRPVPGADPGPPGAFGSRVALAAALGAVLVAVAAGIVVAALLSHREVAALDRRLDTVVAVAETRLPGDTDPAELFAAGRR